MGVGRLRISTLFANLGISRRRAEWFVKWTQETPEWEAIHLISFEKLGRIVYVTGAFKIPTPVLLTTLQVLCLHA